MCRFSFDCLTNVCTDEPRQDDESYAQLTSWDNDSTTYDNFDDGTACSDADDPGSLVCQPRQVCTLTFRIEVLRYFQCTAYPQEWRILNITHVLPFLQVRMLAKASIEARWSLCSLRHLHQVSFVGELVNK